MAYTPVSNELDDIKDLLNESIECCETNTKILYENNKMLYNMNKQLYSHSLILRELLKCCQYQHKPVCGKPYYYVGKGYEEITVSYTTSSPRPPQEIQPITVVMPKRVNLKTNPLIIYPVDRGYFGVLSIPGSWIVCGRRIVDKNGTDLASYLPLCFNYRVYENKTYSNISSNSVSYSKDLELVGMLGYVVKQLSTGVEPLIIYETYNHRTGVRRTFEGSPNLWNKYASNSYTNR
jgi:hypothetical protein